MKIIVCALDNKECDLDKKVKGCRRIKPGEWTGQCFLRLESSRPKKASGALQSGTRPTQEQQE